MVKFNIMINKLTGNLTVGISPKVYIIIYNLSHYNIDIKWLKLKFI